MYSKFANLDLPLTCTPCASPSVMSYSCSECPKVCNTKQKLHLHMFKLHGIYNPLHRFSEMCFALFVFCIFILGFVSLITLLIDQKSVERYYSLRNLFCLSMNNSSWTDHKELIMSPRPDLASERTLLEDCEPFACMGPSLSPQSPQSKPVPTTP